MRLTGIVDRSMDNFFCLRGFAPMLQLSKVSESIPNIQRDLISDHSGEMERFLNSGEFTFFPEVILCTDLQANAATEASIELLRSSITSRINLNSTKVGKITISISAYERQSVSDKRNKDKIQTAYLDFDEKDISKFLRIDGNHRLSAVREDSTYRDKLIPYCLLFFSGSQETDKFCRALFHNINTKQIPLKKEENLTVIIESEQVFSDDVLRTDSSFGLPYICTRKLCKEIKLDHFPQVNQFIGRSKYTYFVDVFSQLLKLDLVPKDESAADVLIQNVADINSALRDSEITGVTENIAVLGAMTVFKLQPDAIKYKRFVSWISKNNIGLTKDLHIDDVISIFDSVYNNMPKKVFLARWYPADTDPTQCAAAKRRFDAIKNIVERDFGLELIDIGTQEGGTFSIREEMYEQIGIADVFIADLTGARHNVMVEVGYALKNIGRKRMLFYYNPIAGCEKPPFDLYGFRCEEIAEAAAMKDVLPKHINAILRGAEIGEI